MLSKGLLFILSAPGGTGKTTLVQKLHTEMPKVEKSVTYTTRKPRAKEQNGVDYHFISEQEFEKKIKNQEMLEYTRLFDCYYGVSKKDVEEKRAQGIHLFLVIDVNGAQKIRERVDAISIFLLPPSLEELEARLHGRGSKDTKEIEERLQRAKEEIEHSIDYDYNIINDELSVAYDALRSIVIAEEHKVRNI